MIAQSILFLVTMNGLFISQGTLNYSKIPLLNFQTYFSGVDCSFLEKFQYYIVFILLSF